MAGLDHPPAHEALRASQEEEPHQRGREPARDLPPQAEVRQREAKHEADRAAPHAVEPFPKVDVLEIIHVHVCARIEALVLGELLVLFEFYFPFLGCRRHATALRPPVDHRQSGARQPCDSTHHNHAEDCARSADKPPANGSRSNGRGCAYSTGLSDRAG